MRINLWRVNLLLQQTAASRSCSAALETLEEVSLEVLWRCLRDQLALLGGTMKDYQRVFTGWQQLVTMIISQPAASGSL